MAVLNDKKEVSSRAPHGDTAGFPHKPLSGAPGRARFRAGLLPGLFVLLAAPGLAFAQSVKDFVEVEGARANKLRGYGIVTGLNGSGDSPRDESMRLVRAMLQNLVSPEAAVEKIESRNAALVLVTTELPPFQKAGTRLDVAVSAVGDAKSLQGGELQLTDLRGPLGRRDPAVYALASGRLVLQGSTATVPGGAIVEKALSHTLVQEDAKTRRRSVILLLKKPDLSQANQLAAQINAAAVTGPTGRLRVAETLDGGSISVRVPTADEVRPILGAEVDFEREPLAWLDRILSLPASLAYAPEAATVTLSDATRTVSWAGEVRLRGGSVMVPPPVAGARPSLFHAREGQRLSEFMDKAAPALNDQQLLDLVKALHNAGLIQGDVRSR